MLGVVQHYREQRRQDIGCTSCRFIPFNDEEDTVPEGYEPMREYPYFTRQCPEHNVPLHKWLVDADTDTAAEWLVEQSSDKKAYAIDWDAWRKACETPGTVRP